MGGGGVTFGANKILESLRGKQDEYIYKSENGNSEDAFIDLS